MKFKVLQENLRKTLWHRIEEEGLTGLRLAQQTGFKQAHISNFLNRKRGLSLEGMDKVLRATPLRARSSRSGRSQQTCQHPAAERGRVPKCLARRWRRRRHRTSRHEHECQGNSQVQKEFPAGPAGRDRRPPRRLGALRRNSDRCSRWHEYRSEERRVG